MFAMLKLSDICEKVVVGHVGSTSKYYCDEGIPFFRTQNVGLDGLNTHELKYITEEFHKSLKKSQIMSGDILLSRVVTDEMRVAIVPEEITKANCANVIVVRPSKKLDKKYFLYLVSSPTAQQYLMGKKKGAAQQVVNTTILKNWEIPLPPLAEQKRIVAKLDAVFAEIDRAIETSDSEIEQSNQLFDALVFERFTKSTDDEPVELKGLTKELLTGPFGSALHKSDYVEDGIAVINPQNLINGEIIPSDGKFINEQKFGELKRYELRQNDIVIARRGEMGRCALVPVSPHKMICGTGCMILRTNDDCSPDFVAELIQSKYVRNALEQGAIGATMLNLNQGILMGVKVQAKTECQQQENTAYIGYARDITSDYIRLKSEKIEKLLALKSAILAQELQPSEAA